ncbi:MAG: S8 family serine peptidase [Nitrosomonadales bacterium]|nr:S8 family serine peptidase [Nitrosomonadales bacterium]
MRFNTTSLIYGLLFPVLLSSCGGGNGGSVAPPALTVPGNVLATAGNGNNYVSWSPVTGATAYNVYWSNISGVSKSNGTKIPNASSPYTHANLTNGTAYYYVVTAMIASGESAESAQVSATPAIASNDPLYADQWHLKNTGQAGAGSIGVPGEDINAEPAWVKYKGIGIRIAVVDDGLEIAHEDLAANVAAGLSYNYLNGSTDPTEAPTDVSTGNGHGTAVAGIAAARDLNGLGGCGVAPRANLVGYNLLQNGTSANEADAMTRGAPNVHVSSSSWGPPDGNGTLDAPLASWRTAIDYGLAYGRSGLGTIYTWAAGNGAVGSAACPSCVDNSNYDGYANYRGVIAVASVNDQGKQSVYSEQGANLWISAPGGDYCNTHTITTTDRTVHGFNPPDPKYFYSDYPNQSYTRCMNGTSAAAPGVAGAVALMLQANPNLGWRDVRLILAQSARKNDATDLGWVTTAYHYNHKYGFGVVDAGAAVLLAASWVNVVPQKTYAASAAAGLPIAIPDAYANGVSNAITVANSKISSIEFIEITFSSDHPYSGDLAITLTSPAGTVSQLSATHVCNVSCTVYSGWVFGSARHLGEAADGNWTLTVKDGTPTNTGTFQSWGLKFYGR